MDRTTESLEYVDVEHAAAEARHCLVLLGMRGTSALTGVQGRIGTTLPKLIMGVGAGNATKHWEPERLVACHDDLLAELGNYWNHGRALELSRGPAKRRKEIKAKIGESVAAEYGDTPLLVVKDPRICHCAPLFIEALEDAGIEARGSAVRQLRVLGLADGGREL